MLEHYGTWRKEKNQIVDYGSSYNFQSMYRSNVRETERNQERNFITYVAVLSINEWRWKL